MNLSRSAIVPRTVNSTSMPPWWRSILRNVGADDQLAARSSRSSGGRIPLTRSVGPAGPREQYGVPEIQIFPGTCGPRPGRTARRTLRAVKTATGSGWGTSPAISRGLWRPGAPGIDGVRRGGRPANRRSRGLPLPAVRRVRPASRAGGSSCSPTRRATYRDVDGPDHPDLVQRQVDEHGDCSGC